MRPYLHSLRSPSKLGKATHRLKTTCEYIASGSDQFIPQIKVRFVWNWKRCKLIRTISVHLLWVKLSASVYIKATLLFQPSKARTILQFEPQALCWKKNDHEKLFIQWNMMLRTCLKEWGTPKTRSHSNRQLQM